MDNEEWIYFCKKPKQKGFIAISSLGRLMLKNGNIISPVRNRRIKLDGRKEYIGRYVLDHFLVTVRRPDQKEVMILNKKCDNICSVLNLKFVSRKELLSDEEFREKISNSAKLMWEDADYKKKMRGIMKSVTSDPIYRLKASIRTKKLYQSNELRKRISDSVKKSYTDKQREMISDASKKMWNNEDTRSKIIVGMKKSLTKTNRRRNVESYSLKNILFKDLFDIYKTYQENCDENKCSAQTVGKLVQKTFKLDDNSVTSNDKHCIKKRELRYQIFDYKFGYFVESIKSYAKSTVDLASDAEVLVDIL